MPSTSERYGSRPAWLRRTGLGVTAVLVAAGLAWLGWVAWSYATPTVTSALLTRHIVDDHTVTARVQVRIADGEGSAGVRCVVQALAVDHSTVGEVTFRPDDGINDVTIRTERPATSVSLKGCTAPGQSRPR